LVFTLRFFQSAAMETRELTSKIMEKMPKIGCNWSSWVSTSRSERAQEFEKGLLFGGIQLFEFLGNASGLAAMAQDGVEKGYGISIVHKT